jgi:hypothetical protein
MSSAAHFQSLVVLSAMPMNDSAIPNIKATIRISIFIDPSVGVFDGESDEEPV